MLGTLHWEPGTMKGCCMIPMKVTTGSYWSCPVLPRPGLVLVQDDDKYLDPGCPTFSGGIYPINM